MMTRELFKRLSDSIRRSVFDSSAEVPDLARRPAMRRVRRLQWAASKGTSFDPIFISAELY
ncbi:hypothetical protein [Azoarcus sp. KH32C]|uniref:hypothetical protein n=1 Tax=Azoarcus sp. KH32C TaxID=748247 RepID=UPI00155AB0AE|nr:hypothetical protein [Azoarcus sp. KH32C]